MENSTNLLRRNFFSSKLFFSKTYFLERTLVSQALELFIMGWVMILVPGGSSLLSSLLVMISMEGMEALSGGCLEAACRYVARGVKLEVLPGLTVTEERLEETELINRNISAQSFYLLSRVPTLVPPW